MDEPTLARAIEPFFSTKGIGKGTGLGLSMVHGLTAQLGGALTIESGVGRGTTVSLWLPVSHDLPAVEHRPPANVIVGEPHGTALLVDDEDLVRMSTAHMLADLGFDVIEASSGESALSMVAAGLDPNLLVTDHLMPGTTGAQLVEAVRMHRPSLKALIVSGYAEAEGIDPALPRLTKPFRRDELAATLAALTSDKPIEPVG